MILNANVAFLAIQSVDVKEDFPDRSGAQIACYISVSFAIGSILIGLVLDARNRANTMETAGKMVSE